MNCFQRINKVVLGLVLIASVSSACAESSEELKLKSIPVSILLGVDPLPGDSLLYAGKKELAVFNTLVGGLGLGLIFYSGTQTHTCEDFCIPDEAVIGAGLYLTSLVWDLLGGVGATISHNREVKKRATTTLAPSLAITPDGVHGSVRLTF